MVANRFDCGQDRCIEDDMKYQGVPGGLLSGCNAPAHQRSQWRWSLSTKHALIAQSVNPWGLSVFSTPALCCY